MTKEIRKIHIDVEKGICKINDENIGAYHDVLEIVVRDYGISINSLISGKPLTLTSVPFFSGFRYS